MPDIILHNYKLSTYAAKARMILNYKRIPWRHVETPMVMPKPDLVALTGGWRMAPVLQIGADVFVDSKVVARQLEAIEPTPTLHPFSAPAEEWALSAWIESIFLDVVTLSVHDRLLPDVFIADRLTAMDDKFFDLDAIGAALPSVLNRVRAACLRLEAQLSDGRTFLTGDRPCLADFSAWVPIGPAPTIPSAAPAIARCKNLLAWRERMAVFDSETPPALDSSEAVAIARAATPQTSPGVLEDDVNNYRIGDRIQFAHAAYCRETVEGDLVRADPWTIAIRREDPRAGDVVVHFPREGTIITRL